MHLHYWCVGVLHVVWYYSSADLCQGSYVFISICLFVCLLTGLCKNYSADFFLHNSLERWHIDHEKNIRFWWCSFNSNNFATSVALTEACTLLRAILLAVCIINFLVMSGLRLQHTLWHMSSWKYAVDLITFDNIEEVNAMLNVVYLFICLLIYRQDNSKNCWWISMKFSGLNFKYCHS